MSVIDRTNLQTPAMRAVREQAEPAGAFSVAWDVPARAIGDARVSAWLRETLGAGFEKLDARIRWRVSAHEACELSVHAADCTMRVLAVAPATMDSWRENGHAMTCATVGDRLALTVLHDENGSRLLYARMNWSELGVEGGRYDVVELVK